MKNRSTFLGLLGALALVGCPTTQPVCPVGTICVDAVVSPDGGPDAFANDANRDAFRAPDTNPPIVCNASGRVGAQCRMGTECTSSAMCVQLMPSLTIPGLIDAPQGDDDDVDHPGYQSIQDPIVAAETVPFNGFQNTFCATQCNTAAMMDSCGDCATCATNLTQAPLIAQFGGTTFITGRMMPGAQFGEDTGLCLISCEYDPATRGDECDEGQTCVGFNGVCVDSCTSDQECSIQYGAAYNGELVTFIPDDADATCNLTTGRCGTTGTAGANVGDACPNGAVDCAPGTGVCLNGGMCAELGCTMATCGTGGICLGINENQSLCVAGCNSATDCDAGNACSMLTMAVGGFNGFCLGVCETDDECRASETCTNGFDADDMPTNGSCTPRCTGVGMRGVAAGCEADEYCRRDIDSAPSGAGAYGTCRPLGVFCGETNTDALPARTGSPDDDCGPAEVCDETLAGNAAFSGNREAFGDGHCTDACTTTADCTVAGTICVTDAASPLVGLCRQPCVAAADVCPALQRCSPTLMYCIEQLPTPPRP